MSLPPEFEPEPGPIPDPLPEAEQEDLSGFAPPLESVTVPLTFPSLGSMSPPPSGGHELPKRRPRPGPPEEVMFPVTPMLDMAFQLLAFFVLTFQAPTAETHLDLDLPVTPAALPGAPSGRANQGPMVKTDSDLENDLWVRAEADDLGDLKALRLGEAEVPDIPTLGERLKRYVGILEGRPLRVRLVADDSLRYEVAARLMASCSAAGVAAIRLTSPAVAGGLP